MKKGLLAIILAIIAIFGWLFYFYERSQHEAGDMRANQLSSHVKTLRGSYDSLKQQSQQWMTERSSLMAKLDSADSSKGAMQQQFDASSLALKDLRTQLEDAASKGTDLESQIGALTNIKSELENKLANSDAITDSVAIVTEIKSKLESALAENKLLTGAKSELETRLMNIQGEASEKSTSFESKIASLSSTKTDLEGRLTDSSATIQDITARLEKSLITNAELREAFAELGAELAQSQASSETLKSELDQLMSNQLQGEQSGSAASLSKPSADELIAAQVAQAVQAKKNLQQQLDTAEDDQLSSGEIDVLKIQLDEATVTINEKLNELKASRDKVNELTGLLQDASGRASNLETEVSQLAEDKAKALQDLSNLESRLNTELHDRDVQIQRLTEESTLIRMGSDIVFRPGSARLAQEGREVLDLIADALDRFPDRNVTIEGHTDNVPISENLQSRYPTNWELSVARAASAARYLVDQGVDPIRLRAAGFGEYRTVADNESPEGRARNRRIEIILVPSSRREKTAKVN